VTYRLLVDRERDGDEAWLKARRKLVTASESAHLMGKVDGSWRKSEEDLAKEKRGSGHLPSSPLLEAGKFWEEPILRYLALTAGLEVQGSPGLYVSDQYPYMGATPDAFVTGSGRRIPALAGWLVVQYQFEILRQEEAVTALHDVLSQHGYRALVEAKNQESKRRSKWNKEAGGPPYYENQAQHQLAVLDDYQINLLVAKVDANELYVHVVESDELYVELLADTCRVFAEKYLTEA
jgi:hypothetical protein